MKPFRDISNHRNVLQVKSALLGTTAWGILETTILSFIGWIDRHIWPDFHTRFMKLLHGNFGGRVVPSTIELELRHENRNWESRTHLIPVNKYGAPDTDGSILKKGETYILPTDEVLSLLMRSKIRGTVGECFCRMYARKHGKICELNAPLQTCMTLYLPQSVENIRKSKPREKLIERKEEIYKSLQEWEKIGLVHQVIWFQQNSTYVICNCCPCCCEVLSNNFRGIKEKRYHQRQIDKFERLDNRINESSNDISEILNPDEQQLYKKLKKNLKNHKKALKMEPTPIVLHSSFISVTINPDNCINCGKCESRCYFGARYMAHGQLHYNPDACVGCGLCVTTCPQEVIQLKRRKKVKIMAKKGEGIEHSHPHVGEPHSHIHVSKPNKNDNMNLSKD